MFIIVPKTKFFFAGLKVYFCGKAKFNINLTLSSKSSRVNNKFIGRKEGSVCP
jgi:hypothetical protein